jgi:hypothetical protein
MHLLRGSKWTTYCCVEEDGRPNGRDLWRVKSLSLNYFRNYNFLLYYGLCSEIELYHRNPYFSHSKYVFYLIKLLGQNLNFLLHQSLDFDPVKFQLKVSILYF